MNANETCLLDPATLNVSPRSRRRCGERLSGRWLGRLVRWLLEPRTGTGLLTLPTTACSSRSKDRFLRPILQERLGATEPRLADRSLPLGLRRFLGGCWPAFFGGATGRLGTLNSEPQPAATISAGHGCGRRSLAAVFALVTSAAIGMRLSPGLRSAIFMLTWGLIGPAGRAVKSGQLPGDLAGSHLSGRS